MKLKNWLVPIMIAGSLVSNCQKDSRDAIDKLTKPQKLLLISLVSQHKNTNDIITPTRQNIEDALKKAKGDLYIGGKTINTPCGEVGIQYQYDKRHKIASITQNVSRNCANQYYDSKIYTYNNPNDRYGYDNIPYVRRVSNNGGMYWNGYDYDYSIPMDYWSGNVYNVLFPYSTLEYMNTIYDNNAEMNTYYPEGMYNKYDKTLRSFNGEQIKNNGKGAVRTFPYNKTQNLEEQLNCNATLFKNNANEVFALTASHCAYDKYLSDVQKHVFWAPNENGEFKEGEGIMFHARGVVYKAGSYSNSTHEIDSSKDIALIKLSPITKGYKTSKYISELGLFDQQENYEPMIGEKMIIITSGSNRYDANMSSGSVDNKMVEGYVEIDSIREYGNTKYACTKNEINDDNREVTINGKKYNKIIISGGDSGSALLDPEGNIVGITSYGTSESTYSTSLDKNITCFNLLSESDLKKMKKITDSFHYSAFSNKREINSKIMYSDENQGSTLVTDLPGKYENKQ